MDKYHETNPPTELKSSVMGREASKKKIEIKVTPDYDIESDEIKLETKIGNAICNKVIELQDKAIRDTLIKLGWIPPIN